MTFRLFRYGQGEDTHGVARNAKGCDIEAKKFAGYRMIDRYTTE